MKSYLVLNTLSLICLHSIDVVRRFIKIKGFTLRIFENVVPTPRWTEKSPCLLLVLLVTSSNLSPVLFTSAARVCPE